MDYSPNLMSHLQAPKEPQLNLIYLSCSENMLKNSQSNYFCHFGQESMDSIQDNVNVT